MSVDIGYLEGKGEQGTRGRATGDNTDPSEQEDIDQCAATSEKCVQPSWLVLSTEHR